MDQRVPIRIIIAKSLQNRNGWISETRDGGIEIRTKVVEPQSPTSKPLYQLEEKEERLPLLHKQRSILLFRWRDGQE